MTKMVSYTSLMLMRLCMEGNGIYIEIYVNYNGNSFTTISVLVMNGNIKGNFRGVDFLDEDQKLRLSHLK